MSAQRQRFAAHSSGLDEGFVGVLRLLFSTALFLPWQAMSRFLSMAALVVLILALFAWWQTVAVEVDAQALRIVRRWPLWRRTLAWSDLRSVDYESGGLRLVRTDRRVFDVDLCNFPEREAFLAAVRQHFEFEFEPWPVAQIPAATSTPSRAQRLQDCAGWGAMLFVIMFIRRAEFELLHGLHGEQNLPLLPWQILPVLCVFLLWPKARAWSEKSPVPVVLLLLTAYKKPLLSASSCRMRSSGVSGVTRKIKCRLCFSRIAWYCVANS